MTFGLVKRRGVIFKCEIGDRFYAWEGGLKDVAARTISFEGTHLVRPGKGVTCRWKPLEGSRFQRVRIPTEME